MHPAASVIFFTTASGAGYGLLFLLGIAGASGLVEPSRAFGVIALAISLGLITGGLITSTAHLGRPERAWRAMSQWKSSWLSREGVAAVVTYLPAGVFAIGWVFFEETQGIWAFFGLLASLGAVATVYCTAQIYATLKTIPSWNNPLVMPGYLALALYTGGLWMTALVAGFSGGETGVFGPLTVLVGVLAVAIKLVYWRSTSEADSNSTSGTATGLGALGRVRLFEAPSTSENYVMREMGYRIARKHADRLRKIALATAFLTPIIFLLLALAAGGEAAAILALLAALSGTLGTLVERWLMFAEARHVVTLYYGAEAA
jgi:sulfite dehydrogenase (quinone) subunit SoeC